MKGRPLLNFLTGLKGDAKKMIAYGVLAPTEFKCAVAGENPWAYAGSTYEDVIGGTKGKLYNLCDDFGQNLADMGKDLVTRVERPFIQLKGRPDPGSVRVNYRGKILPGGPKEDGGYWIYHFDLNRVVFHNLDFAPGDTEEVALSYSM
jgi:hypothetical protein